MYIASLIDFVIGVLRSSAQSVHHILPFVVVYEARQAVVQCTSSSCERDHTVIVTRVHTTYKLICRMTGTGDYLL